MAPKNKLDELFQERFSDLEMDPSTDGWPLIEDRLLRHQQRRRALYLRWLATAAAVILAFYGGYFWRLQEAPVYSTPSVAEEARVNQDPQINVAGRSAATPPQVRVKATNASADPSHNTTQISAHQYTPPSGLIEINRQEKANLAVAEPRVSSESVNEIQRPGLDHMGLPQLNNPEMTSAPEPAAEDIIVPVMVAESGISGSDSAKHNENVALYTTLMPEEVKDIPHLPSNSELVSVGRKTPTGFSLGMALSPTFAFSQVNVNDNTDVAAYNAPNDVTAMSLTAGFQLEYRNRGRWSFEAGLFVNQWSQSNDRLIADVDPGGPVTSTTNLYSNTSTSNIRFGDDDGQNQENFATAADGLLLVPELDETYNFLEFPVSAAFYLAEGRKWSWKLKAGLSPRFLTSSSVMLNYRDGRTENVENLPLRNFSLQLIAGSGVEYRLNQRLRLNLMPAIQYGLTPVNQHNVVDTYFHQFLIYSGLSYSL